MANTVQLIVKDPIKEIINRKKCIKIEFLVRRIAFVTFSVCGLYKRFFNEDFISIHSTVCVLENKDILTKTFGFLFIGKTDLLHAISFYVNRSKIS